MSVEFAVNTPGTNLAEEVNATNVRVLSGGVLAFFDESSSLLVAYAPGSWTHVTVEAGEAS